MRAYYQVTLTQVDDGTVIAKVGCKTLTFTSGPAALEAVRRYFENPDEIIKEFSARYGWSLNEPAPPPGGYAAVGQLAAEARF